MTCSYIRSHMVTSVLDVSVSRCISYMYCVIIILLSQMCYFSSTVIFTTMFQVPPVSKNGLNRAKHVRNVAYFTLT